MKLIIAGAREADDIQIVRDALAASPFRTDEIDQVVSGAARGIDTLGADWARENGIKVAWFEADWEHLGKKAGPIRNQDMADHCEPGDGLLAIPGPNSRGTWDMIRRAEARGLRVFIYRGMLGR